MELKELSDILEDIRYKDWELRLLIPLDGWFIQWAFKDSDGKPWTSRKWFVSSHSCKSEVVQTAFLAARIAEEHELREKFLYKGRSVFGPHIAVEKHWEISEALDVR
jgi:hypothetical protein